MGFRQGKFGGPFGVETFVLSIDTRLFELKFIEDLNGFHLDKTAAGQPGNHNILSKLSMGTGRRADRRLAGFTEDRHQRMLMFSAVKLPFIDTKNGTARLIFFKDPVQKFAERDGTHYISHKTLLAAI